MKEQSLSPMYYPSLAPMKRLYLPLSTLIYTSLLYLVFFHPSVLNSTDYWANPTLFQLVWQYDPLYAITTSFLLILGLGIPYLTVRISGRFTRLRTIGLIGILHLFSDILFLMMYEVYYLAFSQDSRSTFLDRSKLPDISAFDELSCDQVMVDINRFAPCYKYTPVNEGIGATLIIIQAVFLILYLLAHPPKQSQEHRYLNQEQPAAMDV